MTTATSSSANAASLLTSVPQSISQISNPDDALTLLQAVQIVRGNKILQVLKQDIESATQYLDQLNSIAEVLKGFVSKTSGPFTAVTVQSLAGTKKDAGSLRELFSKDGPNLGSTVSEGDAEIEILKSAGVTIDAPVNSPVLVEVFSAEKNSVDTSKPPIRTGFSWYGASELSQLEASSSASAGSYPGSQVRTVTIKDSKGNILEMQRYTVFTDYSMRRPAQASVTAAIASLQQKFDAALSTISSMVLEVVNGREKLEVQLKKQKEELTEAIGGRDEQKNNTAQVIIEFFRIVRQYRQERELSRLKPASAESNMNGQSGLFGKNPSEENSGNSDLSRTLSASSLTQAKEV